MINYLKNSNRLIKISFFIIFSSFFSSCKSPLTLEQFKNKYDYIEDTVTAYSTLNTTLYLMKFSYNGVKYDFLTSGDVPLQDKDQFVIIFDKNAPDTNYLVLWQYPVRPYNVKYNRNICIINHLKNATDDYFYVSYKYKFEDDWFTKKRYAAIPISYYEEFNKVDNDTKEVVVDFFYVPSGSANRFYVQPIINIEKTIELYNTRDYDVINERNF